MNVSLPKQLRSPINIQSINPHAQKTYTNSNVIKISAIWRHDGKILNVQNLGRLTNFEDEQHIMSFIEQIFLCPLNQVLWILMNVPSINPMLNSSMVMPNTNFPYEMGCQISSPMASLTQDAMKVVSSQIAPFDQFHRKASYV